MADPIILCTDGSDIAIHALRAGLALVHPELRPVVVTVIESSDPMLVTGTGMAGGTMSPEEYESMEAARVAEGEATVAETTATLGLDGAETRVLRGDPAGALCDLATEIGAAAIVMGSRGRGGIKRALLGSVSDYVVRNAECPVIVTNDPND